MGGIGDILDPIGIMGDLGGGGSSSSDITDASQTSADAQVRAAEIEAEYQREALNYLKDQEELPTEYRDWALAQLKDRAATGVDQDQMIQDAMASPLYGALMGGQEAGEEAIMRNAAATGGLRSGDVQSNMYDYNVQLENQALLSSYNNQMNQYQQQTGLQQGLAGIPSLAPQIAQMTSNIGSTLGTGQAGYGNAISQGQIAAAQANATSQQQGIGNLLGLGSLGLSAYDSGMFSDRRLKKNIKKIGTAKGFNFYRWDWNAIAEKMGLVGSSCGCMADEVYVKRPEAVSIKDYFMFVDYSKIGILGEA